MKRTRLMLLLTIGAMMMATMLSCSDDNKENTAANNPLVGSLVGSWLGEYSAKGQTSQGTNSIAGTYIKAVKGLVFNDDGTGTYTKFLCNVANEPLSIYGGQMDKTNGRFHYTSNSDGTVSITLDGDGDAENPKKWTVHLTENGLSSEDGGTSFLLKVADENQKAMLANWEEILRSGGNGETNDKSFLTEWETKTMVYVNGITQPQYLPWAGSAKSDIPEEILSERKKVDGWEMAFCSLCDPYAGQTRYFGLYNRYRGILRVYMYIPDASAYGNEMAFDVQCGKTIKNAYPFFNSMMYGIPTNKPYTGWTEGINLETGTSIYKPLTWVQTPYTEKTKADGVSVYWHCFDLDMSGYQPTSDNEPWRSHIDGGSQLLSILPISQSTSDIKLTGKLTGTLSGTFNNPVLQSSPANPDLHRAKIAMNFLGSMFSGLIGTGAQAATLYNIYHSNANLTADAAGLSIAGLAGGIFGFTCSSIGALLNNFDQQEIKVKEAGRIDLNLDANIDMTGVMKEWHSLNDGGLQLTPNVLKETNPDCHIGEGCFGLAESPVVVISKEDLLSDVDHVNITFKDGKYQSGSNEENERYALRFVTFLDPNSIKLNLNTNLYHNIENLTVTAICGVNTSLPVGNTDSYRKLLKLNDRPTLSFPDPQNNVIELNAKSSVRLHKISCDDVLKGDTIAFPNGVKMDSVKLVKQVGNEIYRYYGPCGNLWGYNIMLEPQAYIPFNDKIFSKPIASDLIVAVCVTFDCTEHQKVMLVKQYVPDFKVVTHSELASYYTKLNDFYTKSKKGEDVGELANNNKIKYKSNSYLFMKRALNMLKKVSKR